MSRKLHILNANLVIPGLGKTLRILHVTDVHLCECDRRDPRQEKYLAWIRECRGDPVERFDRLLAELPHLAPDFVAFTGDLFDSPTRANMEAATKRLKALRIPYGLTFGNHEWDWPAHGTAERRPAHRRSLWRLFRREFGCHPEFQIYSLPGIQLLFLDNSDYQVSGRQFNLLQAELHPRNPPALLFYHIPVALRSLSPAVMTKWHDPIMCGEPGWDGLRREHWQVSRKDLPSTLRFRDLVLRSRSVVGAFCGHVHLEHADRLPSGAQQFVTPTLYEGHARLITLRPAPPARSPRI